MIQIALISYSDIFINGMKRIISKTRDLKIVTTIKSVNEAETLFHKPIPDIVVVDVPINFQPIIHDILKFTIGIKSAKRSASILIMTDFTNKSRFALARKLGINGYCTKNISEEDLIEVLYKLKPSETYVHEDYEILLSESSDKTFGSNKLNLSLSSRHQEVLSLMLWGLSNAEIGELLHISVPTVKAHVKVILHTLNARDRTMAIASLLQDKIHNNNAQDFNPYNLKDKDQEPLQS